MTLPLHGSDDDQQLAYMQTMGGGGQKFCTLMNECPTPNQFGVNEGPTLQLLVGYLIFLNVFNKNGTCENLKVQKMPKMQCLALISFMPHIKKYQ